MKLSDILDGYNNWNGRDYSLGLELRKTLSIFEINPMFLFLLLQVDTFTSIYKKLTGREVTFEFPEPYL